jgi:hypothetical protein
MTRNLFRNIAHQCTVKHVTVPDRGVRGQGQLIWQDVACDSKAGNAVNIVAVLFVLFFSVMYIWGDLQVYGDLGLWIYSQI